MENFGNNVALQALHGRARAGQIQRLKNQPLCWWQLDRLVSKVPDLGDVKVERISLFGEIKRPSNKEVMVGMVQMIFGLIWFVSFFLTLKHDKRFAASVILVMPLVPFLLIELDFRLRVWEVWNQRCHAEISKATQDPAELIIAHLLEIIRVERALVLGSTAPIQLLREKLEKRYQEVLKHSVVIQLRAHGRHDESRATLKNAHHRLATLAERLSDEVCRIDAFMMKTRAYYNGLEDQIRGLHNQLSDIPVLERARQLEADAEAELAEAEDVILSTVNDINASTTVLRHQLAENLEETGAGLFLVADAASVEMDLRRYEELTTIAFKLPKARHLSP